MNHGVARTDVTSPAARPRMDLGQVGIWTNQLNGLPAVELRDVLQELDGLGFGALWSGESASGREAFTHAALALGVTERIVVATGIASIWARDASATASAQRMLHETFLDRFLLGLGVSHSGQVSARGHDYSRPLAAMRHHLRAMDEHSFGDMPPPHFLPAACAGSPRAGHARPRA
jgi:alkanesulfonate monooxygenase SsuD/methylene tetrahydromethanopterin reductase-like flavin-dependent oxidoreductase (luciferase family)